MNSIDLKEFVPAPTRTFNIFVIREGALDILSERLKYKQLEMDHTAFLIESCLYLIWTHLDYYMLKAVPKNKNYGFGNLNETGKKLLIFVLAVEIIVIYFSKFSIGGSYMEDLRRRNQQFETRTGFYF